MTTFLHPLPFYILTQRQYGEKGSLGWWDGRDGSGGGCVGKRGTRRGGEGKGVGGGGGGGERPFGPPRASDTEYLRHLYQQA